MIVIKASKADVNSFIPVVSFDYTCNVKDLRNNVWIGSELGQQNNV